MTIQKFYFKMYRALIFILLFITYNLNAQNSTFIKVWPGKPLYATTPKNMERGELGKDGVTRYFDITIPTLEYYSPENPSGPAVIICPGGGYRYIAYTNEGINMAKWFAKQGVAAFILKYRIPNDDYMEHKDRVPLADAQESILYLRKNADKYGIDPDKIGVIGFSAGGHLAATLSTHFNKPVIPNDEKINLRPDFNILIYPVISMRTEVTHRGSENSLLGKNPSNEMINEYSNELHVTEKTPITFLMQASDDPAVPVANSIVYYEALIQNHIPAAMHFFQKAGHGFTMKNPWVDKQWLYLLHNWLIENKIIEGQE